MINLDPRTKIVVILCLSTLAIFLNSPRLLLLLFVFTLVILLLFHINFFGIIFRFNKLMPILLVMLIMQSVFTSGGQVLVSLHGVNILTSHGVSSALCILFRMLIFFGSAMIIMTSSPKDYILALVQFKIPYEIAFMVMVAFRFLPVLKEELNDTLVAMQLRGVELKRIAWRKKIKFYTHFLTPLLSSVMIKAYQLSITMESRAFRVYRRRTYLRLLKYSVSDYLVTVFLLTVTIVVLLQDLINQWIKC
ncbi:MAG: Energy-coupling factor transporter transmembrane protein EcfT [Pelotomaculum sp. PtaB.Bin013]|uniref:Energy-coupling factor transporter transmembrane protein EcfT n=1 Tax=Pelotomaculum isophthalicicum JI TaxID=947010 RepID=A0A9X4JWF9_9FIRM|nr:energy-coupling factor transporter transmembrane component T [Pelotomaculum isophthalicicum]MDF9409028.1 energy-coupling factor transporter transmembrane protein EcfT [Pelotomaculum isophthalicicum JI]OPX91353.1 MAG: Energy-coupling factor transporter transmembrane protein EcfT [Pelotomaculum sp. PtaB.Bin013]